MLVVMSPERWDEGINALLLGYSFSGANSIHSSADSDSGDSYFLNLNSGVNLGPWRLRNNSTWSRSSGQTAEWKNLSSYLQRAVIPLKGELTVGDDYTAGDFSIVSAFVVCSWRQMTTCCQTA